MRAIICRAYGSPESLVLDDVPEPVPGPGQVLVRVHAAAVNFPDVLFIEGKYQIKIPPPFIPGNEIAGEVIAAGAGAPYSPGQRVAGTTFGAFAEQALLDSTQATLIPDDADFASAAAFGVTYRTAYYALRSTAAVTEGDWVVVLGAAGGVGLAAVDLAVAMKARVLAAASSREKLELCRQRGAEATVDYDREDLKLRIRELTGNGPGGLGPGRRKVLGAGAAGSGARRHLRHPGLRGGYDSGHSAQSCSAQRSLRAWHGNPHLRERLP